MEVIAGVLGVALLLLGIVDLLWTTLWVDGSGGPITSRMTTGAWRIALRLGGRRHHRALSLFGPTILVATVLLWITLAWAGWVLIFSSDSSSLIDTRDDGTAGVAGRIWFVAYSMFTVGNGDFTPEDGLWQIVASLVGGSGLFVATLSVTYLLSVLSAVVSKRAFAQQVSGLGSSAEDLVLSGWNGGHLHALDRHLAGFASRLSELTEQHLSYPVLQYYHAADAGRSAVKAVAVLHDALNLMSFGVGEAARPEVASLASARSAVDAFIDDTRELSAVAPPSEPPPLPHLSTLRQRGIPTIDQTEFERSMQDVQEQRRNVLGLLRNDGWEWSE